jgi:hypothetical protein
MQHHDDLRRPPARGRQLRWKINDKLLLLADWTL